MKVLLIFACLIALVASDCYLHFPPGSNNRNQENNVNRNNANRLFDSQNNGKGGYCRGPAMTFYTGSLLHIEWTTQHGCGQSRMYCNVVVQFMCGDSAASLDLLIRDGTTTDTIDDNPGDALQVDSNGEPVFGLHEPYTYYEDCRTRQRNMGLFIADRQAEGGLSPGRNTARFTRQDNNGNRHGYECQEEREYYPYWQPTPWRDIAIFTNNPDHCSTYQKESQNVKKKGHCVESPTDPSPQLQNNKGACEAAGKHWVEEKSFGLPKPVCMKAWWNRENHLGSGVDGYANTFNWTIPEDNLGCDAGDNRCNCVFRIRYNISTADLNGMGGNDPSGSFIDASFNGDRSPVKDDEIVYQDELPHQLALDTTQFGRTFEDRSHVFHLRKRPKKIPPHAKIYNLNVRGKRGNIVQAYPAVEYDFIPSHLSIYKNDYIHFQWTGCDHNPAGNAGEGTQQTDRSNIVQVVKPGDNIPAADSNFKKISALFESKALRRRMAMLDQPVDNPNLCKSWDALLSQNGGNENNAEQDIQNCMKLNAAQTPYFDGGAIRMNTSDTFNYISTRNNNFSNRDQKGVIVVNNLLPTWAIVIVVLGCVIFLAAGAVAAAMFYSRSHPHSTVARLLSKM